MFIGEDIKALDSRLDPNTRLIANYSNRTGETDLQRLKRSKWRTYTGIPLEEGLVDKSDSHTDDSAGSFTGLKGKGKRNASFQEPKGKLNFSFSKR